MKFKKLDLRIDMQYKGWLLFSALSLLAAGIQHADRVHADELHLLTDEQLDGISAGATEQLVTANANSSGLLSLTGSATGAGVANSVVAPGVSVGGAAGGGGAVACCSNSHTDVSGATVIPGSVGATGAQTQTFANQGLSITIGLFGGAGTGP